MAVMMRELFLTLVNRSIAAGWLILAILLLRPFLRRVSRSICCALWGLVAFRLLCPFSFESVLSLIPEASSIPTVLQPSVASEAVSSGTPVSGSLPLPHPPTSVAASPTPTALQIASVMWIVGVALFILYALLSYLRIFARVRISARKDGFWVCERIGTPFVLGFFRPRIYMPHSVNVRDVPYILAHERAHIARRDHIRKAFAFALLAAFWFHPFVWVAFFLLCRDIEFACDERALRTLGTDAQHKKAYAEALVRGSFPRLPILTCPIAFGGLQVKQRVLSVAKYRKPALSLVLVTILLCGAVAVCFLTDPKADADAVVTVPADGSETTDPAPSKAPAEEEQSLAKAGNTEEERAAVYQKFVQEWYDTETDENGNIIWQNYALPKELAEKYGTRDSYELPSILVFKNIGELDGSVTIELAYGTYFHDTDTRRVERTETVTIAIPAGEIAFYDIENSDHCLSFGFLSATYGGMTANLRQ